jgi:hypothetical protein
MFRSTLPSKSGDSPGAYQGLERETYLAWVEADWPFTFDVDVVDLDTLRDLPFGE